MRDVLMSGHCIRILTIIDVLGRSCPALEVDLPLTGQRVVRVLEQLRLQDLLPQRLCTENGPAFTGKAIGKATGAGLSLPGRASRLITDILKATTASFEANA